MQFWWTWHYFTQPCLTRFFLIRIVLDLLVCPTQLVRIQLCFIWYVCLTWLNLIRLIYQNLLVFIRLHLIRLVFWIRLVCNIWLFFGFKSWWFYLPVDKLHWWYCAYFTFWGLSLLRFQFLGWCPSMLCSDILLQPCLQPHIFNVFLCCVFFSPPSP